MDLQPLLGSSLHDVHRLRPGEAVRSGRGVGAPDLFDMQGAAAATTHVRGVRT